MSSPNPRALGAVVSSGLSFYLDRSHGQDIPETRLEDLRNVMTALNRLGFEVGREELEGLTDSSYLFSDERLSGLLRLAPDPCDSEQPWKDEQIGVVLALLAGLYREVPDGFSWEESRHQLPQARKLLHDLKRYQTPHRRDEEPDALDEFPNAGADEQFEDLFRRPNGLNIRLDLNDGTIHATFQPLEREVQKLTALFIGFAF